MRTLRYGDEGPMVRYVQTALTRAGEDSGTADGIFGKRTERAVRAFQSNGHLLTDGVVGRFTWAALYPYLVGSTFAMLKEGDSPKSVASRYRTDADAIETANPGIAWRTGETVVVQAIGK